MGKSTIFHRFTSPNPTFFIWWWKTPAQLGSCSLPLPLSSSSPTFALPSKPTPPPSQPQCPYIDKKRLGGTEYLLHI